ncbi:oligosaccharide flippase family protein [Pseudarthrobacter sp. fls2-241-R2A-127]|uniref:oligosaccharide flippase family protein n=1 Tax=Pseudarthrobacter sp. fls2-241-R2A-127 TaxID=3040303 RepID=UPI003305D8DC
MLVCQVAYTSISARILAPADFGPYALAVSVAQVGTYFVGSGVVQAVLQARESDRQSRLSATSLVFAAGSLVGIVISAIAAVLSSKPDTQVMSSMLFLLAWMPMATGISGVATASMRRSGRFRLPSLTEAMGLILSLVLSLVCMVLGVGALSLAIGSLSSPLISAILAWTLLREMPRLAIARIFNNELFKVASHISGQNLVHYIQYTAPLWTLGASDSTANVGHYSRAQAVATIPLNQLSQAFTRVVYPHLAATRHNGGDVSSPIRKSLSIGLSLSGVVFGAICGLAEPLTLSFLGEQWRPAIQLTGLWAIFAAVNLCYVAAGSSLESQGRFSAIWRVQFVSLVVLVPALVGVYLLGSSPVRILFVAIFVQVVAHSCQLLILIRSRYLRFREVASTYLHGIVLFSVVAVSGFYSTGFIGGNVPPFLSLLIGGAISCVAGVAYLACTYWATSTRNLVSVLVALKPQKLKKVLA